MNEIMTKRCRDCWQFLSSDQFRPTKSSKDGLACYCRKCEAKHSALTRLKVKQAIEDMTRQILESNGVDYDQLLAPTKVCAICGSTHSLTLFQKSTTTMDKLVPYCGWCNSKVPKEDLAQLRAFTKAQSKVCDHCGQRKPRDQFLANPRAVDGLRGYCITCTLTLKKQRRTK